MNYEVIVWGAMGTLTLWFCSALLALLIAVVLANGVLNGGRFVRPLSKAVINLTRGIPTSILVLTAGIAMMRMLPAYELPVVFVGTPALFQPLAWAIVVALAIGSAGHLAEIFLAARASVGRVRIEQMYALGLLPIPRTCLLCRECSSVALPAISGRLVHHLHNTAFAALFPVAELFGTIQSHANRTFEIMLWVVVGALTYILLSGGIWLIGRLIEAWLRPPRRQLGTQQVVA